MMVGRYFTAIVLGCVVTLGVLFTMQILIASPRSNLDESGRRHFVDFVRVERQEELQRRDRRREKPTPPDAPPSDAIEPRTDAMDHAQIAPSVPRAPVQADVEMSITGIGLVASDGDYLPIVKITPVYPMIARTRGIEGHCEVSYTVTATGTTKDVVVVDADPRGIFDKVSVEAALKFKYRPRVVNGEPIEVRGVHNIFYFRLED